jgi:4-diphosphocytidyl-2-C-methyl-D-erythritol kinase
MLNAPSPPTTLVSPAKINLWLNVTGQRADGFHELTSLLLRLEGLSDELTFTIDPTTDNSNNSGTHATPALTLTCNQPVLANAQNILHTAHQAFYAMFNHLAPLGLAVHLHKNIPMQAGLGGGSSNAATLLNFLFAQHQLPGHAMADLLRVGASVGSDVPFFIATSAANPMAMATGRGERITLVPIAPDHPLLRRGWWLIQPPQGMSTAYAYQVLRQSNTYQANTYKALDPSALLTSLQGHTLIDAFWHNDFEPVMAAHSPHFDHICKLMQRAGISRPLLCGSGSVVAGLLPDRADRNLDMPQVPEQWWQCIIEGSA